MKTLIMEIVTLVVFIPLRMVSRLFGRRANAKVRDWQDNTWTWFLGAAAVGYMIGDHHAGADPSQSVGGYDPGGHFDGGHHGGPHDTGGGGFDGGGGFGGDIGSF